MKKLLTLAVLLTGILTSIGQQRMVLTSLAANTVSNLVSQAALIDNFAIVNATTNDATVTFYDSSNTSTTIVRNAYVSYSSYATNFNVVFTNATGVLVTNTFSGMFTGPTTNSAVTNARPVIMSIPVPANSILNKDVRLQVLRGINAIPNQAVTITTTYRLPQ